jgi:chemotaxis protein methyltransferase CheR
MNTSDFTFLIELIKKRSGIVLSADKGYLVESRLVPVAQRNGCGSVDELVRKMHAAPNEKLSEEVTEAMTTNESFFFRDKTPFEYLKELIIPQMKERRGIQKRINFWCAAASTGQEPYSIAMILKEASPILPNWNFKIVGTDLSQEVLDKAQSGTYSQFEVQRGLPINLLMKFFKQDGEIWSIDPAIRAMVQYKNYNLLNNFKPLGNFDVVFMRNVLIYFDKETKKSILERTAALMPDDGYLVLGAAETVIGITDAFRPLKSHRGLYERNPDFAVGTRPALGARPLATPATASPARTLRPSLVAGKR